MDLIYTNKNRVDQGVLINYSYDQEDKTTNSNECTFEVQTPSNDNVFEIGSFLYMPSTEIGGRVDAIKIDTASRIVYASGKTWRGLLAEKLLYNTSGDYYQISGNIASIFKDLIDNQFSMGDVFSIELNNAIPPVNVKIANYTDLYKAMLKAVVSVNYKVKTVYDETQRKVVISFKPIAEYTRQNNITSDLFEFTLQTGSEKVNHAIGVSDVGTVHRYLQADGSIGSIKYFSGIDEIVAKYDISASSEADLIIETDNSLKSEKTSDSLEVSARDLDADLLDYFEAEDIATGISMSQNVTKKIIRINHDIITYQYEMGARRL